MRRINRTALLGLPILLLVGRSLIGGHNPQSASSMPAAGPATLAAATTSAPAMLTPRRLPGVENFARISDGLYRGAQPTAEGFAELKKMGIRTIVNLRALHSDRDELKGLGLRYVHIKCQAWNPENEEVLAFLKIVSDPVNQPVFVHCQHGADRTGYMVAVYRMMVQNWSLENALRELNMFGFHPIWAEITGYLKTFETEAMRQKLVDAPAPRISVVE